LRIDETLRRAAGLFVELPPAEPKETKPWSVMDTDASSPTPSPRVSAQPIAPMPKVAPARDPDPVPPPATKTVEQIVRDSPGPNLDEIKPAASASASVIDGSGNVSLTSIYGLANLPACPFSAEQVLELLSTLPAELPIQAKRATVNVTVNAMAKATGVTADAIVADASRKLAALAAYAKSYADQASQFITRADAEITALQAEIEQKKRAIDDAKDKQTQMVHACTTESDRLDEVLEFFSLDVHPSKYASTPGDPA